jgi:hypothetical protein
MYLFHSQVAAMTHSRSEAVQLVKLELGSAKRRLLCETSQHRISPPNRDGWVRVVAENYDCLSCTDDIWYVFTSLIAFGGGRGRRARIRMTRWDYFNIEGSEGGCDYPETQNPSKKSCALTKDYYNLPGR